jgi:hypothetical protein
LREALDWTGRTLEIDEENLEAHYLRYQIFQQLENLVEADSVESQKYREQSDFHLQQAERFRPDFNARDSAVGAARARYPAGNEASEELVIYELQRDGAYELPDSDASASGSESAQSSADQENEVAAVQSASTE